MSARTQWSAALAALWVATAGAQPAGPTVVHGGAQFQQMGNSLLVTTTDGAGTRHSVIDWRSFSVPAGSTTRFQQPGADSLSINRVTGNRPSDIFGTLSSNGQLVLVNPSGIAVGRGAVVDTAGFTASALALSDADARAGLLRFEADKGSAKVDVRGSVIARNGDVVLLGTDVQVDKDAVVRAPNGSIVLAAGQRVALTGRGLEGIVLEVRGKGDKVVNLGRLEGDAVGLFASHLRHTGLIQARRVVLSGDKVKLEQERGKDPDRSHGPNGQEPEAGGPDDVVSGRIDTSGAAPRDSDDPRPSAALPVFQAHATKAVLRASQELASVEEPDLEGPFPHRRRRGPALQCTR